MTTTQAHPPAPGPAPNARHRLERSRDDRVVAGVCGGLARHFDVDPTLVRVLAVISVFFGGFGVFAYLAGVLLIPDADAGAPVLSGGADHRRGVAIAGAIGLGFLLLVSWGWIGGWAGGDHHHGGWPLLFVGAAAVVVLLLTRDRDARRKDPPPPPPSATGGAADAPATPTTRVHPSNSDAPTTPMTDLRAHPTVAPKPAPKRSWAVTGTAFGIVLVITGILGTLEAVDAIDLGWGEFLALVVILVGGALVGSAFWGGARGLIPIGIALALVLGTAVASGVSLHGGVGEETHAPTAAGAFPAHGYRLAIGHMKLDLRDLHPAAGTRHVKADVGVGQLEIVAPPGTHVTGGGLSDRFHGEHGTGGVDVDRTIWVDGPAGRVAIDGHVGVGAITVDDDTKTIETGDRTSGALGGPATGAHGSGGAAVGRAAGAHDAGACVPSLGFTATQPCGSPHHAA